jgi:CDP-glucose 4,6-dehydratase
MVIDPVFWKGRNVFLTGHTGFKGSWMSLWLSKLGANVTGYALDAPTEPSMFHESNVESVLVKNVHADINDDSTLINAMLDSEPDIVIHMAAQSLVRESYIEPAKTYKTNVMGTVNLFEAIRKTPSVKATLNITSDKCYENKEWVWGYRENDAMGGHDPYSSSKGCSELVSSAYRRSFMQDKGIALATARAGNVIGGGDWAVDRIVPDAMRAFIANKPLVVRNPMAIRPWQHVLEPLSGYLMLCQQLINQPDDYAREWNFGPNSDDAKPVSYLADGMVQFWGDSASWQLDENDHPHEANHLKLDCSRANTVLKWKPIWDINQALSQTVSWYRRWNEEKDMYNFTIQQIEEYQQA